MDCRMGLKHNIMCACSAKLNHGDGDVHFSTTASSLSTQRSVLSLHKRKTKVVKMID